MLHRENPRGRVEGRGGNACWAYWWWAVDRKNQPSSPPSVAPLIHWRNRMIFFFLLPSLFAPAQIFNDSLKSYSHRIILHENMLHFLRSVKTLVKSKCATGVCEFSFWERHSLGEFRWNRSRLRLRGASHLQSTLARHSIVVGQVWWFVSAKSYGVIKFQWM